MKITPPSSDESSITLSPDSLPSDPPSDKSSITLPSDPLPSNIALKGGRHKKKSHKKSNGGKKSKKNKKSKGGKK